MAEHTSGPWTAGRAASPHAGWQVDAPEDTGYGSVAGVWREADAHLIAAAPDLYQALESLLYAISGVPDVPEEAEERAEQAIAKARGEA